MELTTCPECGVPAEITERHVLESTDGPIEHAKVRCAARHFFFLPVASLEAASRVVQPEISHPRPTPATPAARRP